MNLCQIRLNSLGFFVYFVGFIFFLVRKVIIFRGNYRYCAKLRLFPIFLRHIIKPLAGSLHSVSYFLALQWTDFLVAIFKV